MAKFEKNKLVHWFIIGTFISLYLIVSIISTIHVVDFFELSNPTWLAVSLAIAFEVGAAASLAAIMVLEKTSRSLVWFLFILLTAMQAMGNSYFCFVNLEDYQGWIELFGLTEEEPIFQKRVLSVISGAILPIIALGFIKSLVDYVKPKESKDLKLEHQEDLDLGKAIPEPSIGKELDDLLDEFDDIDESRVIIKHVVADDGKKREKKEEIKEIIRELIKEIPRKDDTNSEGDSDNSTDISTDSKKLPPTWPAAM